MTSRLCSHRKTLSLPVSDWWNATFHLIRVYRTLVISAIIFFVIDGIALGINVILSQQIEQDALAINIAGRQRMLSQRMIKALLLLERQQYSISRVHESSELLDELEEASALFGSTLKAFETGGVVENAGMQNVWVDAVPFESGQAIIRQTSRIWKEYRLMLNSIAETGEKIRINKQVGLSEQDSLTFQSSVSRTVRFAEQNTTVILSLMNQLTYEWEQVASKKASQIRTIQVIAIVFALLNFLLFCGYYLVQLHNRNLAVNEYSTQLQQTYNSLQEQIIVSAERRKLFEAVVYDSRNPLAAIYGIAEAMSTGAVEPPVHESLLRQVRLASQHILHFMKNAQEDLQLREERYVFLPLEIQVLPLLEQVIDTSQYVAREKNIAVVSAIETNISSLRMVLDKQAFMRILECLINNAIKFSPPNSVVEIHADKNTAKGTLRIEVRDNGPGVPFEEMDMLFRRFTKLSTLPTANEYSTGLELVIAQQLVLKHQGRIWCESELGKGATFIVELPTMKKETT